MRDSYKILAADREEMQRHQRKYYIMFSVALLISISIFSYSVLRNYSAKWQTLKAARKFAIFIEDMKGKAITSKKPIEVRFIQPDIIEVNELSNCSELNTRNKIITTTLSDFGSNVIFVDSKWIFSKAPSDEHFTIPPIIERFCYDPTKGSSIGADLKQSADQNFVGSLFLSSIDLVKKHEAEKHHHYIQDWLEDWSVEVDIQGPSAQLKIL